MRPAVTTRDAKAARLADGSGARTSFTPRDIFYLAGVLVVFVVALWSRDSLIENVAQRLPSLEELYFDVYQMFLPILDHRFTLGILFTHWQEHRQVIQRIYECLFFLIRGQFDYPLEMKVNAFIYVSSMLGLVWALGRKIQPARWPLLVCAAVVLIVPFDYENTCSAMQVQFYFFFIAIMGSCWLFAAERFLPGCVVAAVGILTLGSGFLGAPAFALFLCADYLRTRSSRFPELAGRLAVIGLICALGLLSKTHMPYNDQLIARTAGVFFDRFCRYLAWPSWYSPWLVLFNVLPAALLAFSWWKRGGGFAERFVLIAWLTQFLEAVAISWQRAGPDSGAVSRYQDNFAPLLVINCAALGLLWQRKQPLFQLATGGWLASAVAGMAGLMQFTYYTGLPWYSNHQRQMDGLTVLAFRHPESKPQFATIDHQFPFTDPNNGPQPKAFDDLFDMLADPRITNIIPRLDTEPLTIQWKKPDDQH